MNKKVNTLLFILGATLFNILVVIVAGFLLLMLYARLLAGVLPDAAHGWAFPLIFIASIAASFVVYRLVLNKIMGKIRFEDYFDPIIKPRRPPPRKNG